MARQVFSFSAAAVVFAVGAQQPLIQDFARPTATYTVAEDSGGEIIRYLLKVAEVRESKSRVQIAGRCDSACTLFLSLPADKICLTQDAYFRFHLPLADDEATVREAEHILMLKYPDWVKSWIAANHGLSQDLITMEYAYASSFVPPCDGSMAAG